MTLACLSKQGLKCIYVTISHCCGEQHKKSDEVSAFTFFLLVNHYLNFSSIIAETFYISRHTVHLTVSPTMPDIRIHTALNLIRRFGMFILIRGVTVPPI